MFVNGHCVTDLDNSQRVGSHLIKPQFCFILFISLLSFLEDYFLGHRDINNGFVCFGGLFIINLLQAKQWGMWDSASKNSGKFISDCK